MRIGMGHRSGAECLSTFSISYAPLDTNTAMSKIVNVVDVTINRSIVDAALTKKWTGKRESGSL